MICWKQEVLAIIDKEIEIRSDSKDYFYLEGRYDATLRALRNVRRGVVKLGETEDIFKDKKS